LEPSIQGVHHTWIEHVDPLPHEPTITNRSDPVRPAPIPLSAVRRVGI
jgi:hypothetical protein